MDIDSTTLAIITIIVLVILYFVFINADDKSEMDNSAENFDAYRNHSYGAQRTYHNKKNQKLSLDNAELNAKYMWNEPNLGRECEFKKGDPNNNGYDLHDYNYEYHVRNINNAPDFDSDYVYRGDDFDSHDKSIDTKFDTLGDTYSGTGNNYLASYNINCMQDSEPVYTTFNGEVLHLAQKQH